MFRRPHLLPTLLVVAGLFVRGIASAHGVGSSEIRASVSKTGIDGVWEIHLHDARLALGIDTTLAGEAGWQDLRGREPELRALLTSRFTLKSNGQPCALVFDPAPMEWQPAKSVVSIRFKGGFPSEPTRLEFRNELLFDLDPSHRAYYLVDDPRITHVGAFRDRNRVVALEIHQLHVLPAIAEFVGDGAGELRRSLDSLLFLLALLLPAGLLREGSSWSRRAGMSETAREAARVIAAFSLGLTAALALSFFGVIRFGSRFIESAIAVSVFAAAWNNLRPFLTGRVWLLALGFGLAHGMGFSGALNNLSLPRDARGLALGSFNVGIELGLLALALAAVPVLHALSRLRAYPRWIMGVGSLAIAWIGALWVLERAFGLQLFGHP